MGLRAQYCCRGNILFNLCCANQQLTQAMQVNACKVYTLIVPIVPVDPTVPASPALPVRPVEPTVPSDH